MLSKMSNVRLVYAYSMLIFLAKNQFFIDQSWILSSFKLKLFDCSTNNYYQRMFLVQLGMKTQI